MTALSGVRVGIVGASVAGLAAARFLRERGATVRLFERSPVHLSERGGGIALDPAVLPLIGSLRGERVKGRVVVGASGRVLWRRPVTKFMTAWSEIYRALQEHVPEELVLRGCPVDGCEESGVVRFVDGSTEEFDYVLGCDGLGSVVRTEVAPRFDPAYLGYVAVRGSVPEDALPGACAELHAWADDPGLVNCYGPRTHVVAYWIPGRVGRVLNWMWYRNVDERDVASFLRDRDGGEHHWSLPPGQLPGARRTALLKEMHAAFPRSFAAMADATPELYLQAIYRGVPDTLRRGRLVLLGDAAHIAVPHIGAGSSLAVRDAHTFADALVADELDAWADQRREQTRRDLDVATAMGRSLQHEDHDWEQWHEGDFDRWWQDTTGPHRLYFDS